MKKHKLYGRRVLHFLSPVRFDRNVFKHSSDSNYKVVEKTIKHLPMCHHYILVSDSSTLVRRTGSEDKKTQKYHF